MIHPAADAEVVIIGGGIAGGALATFLARAGVRVTVLERSTVFEDKVRGEYAQPWGVAEAQRLGVLDALLGSGGGVVTRIVPYDELLDPDAAEAAAVTIDGVVPGVPGALAMAHPLACTTLLECAEAAGAEVLRGVDEVTVEAGPVPRVHFGIGGASHVCSPRVVVGADGRESRVRKQVGAELQASPARLLGAGLLVEGDTGWPQDTFTVAAGTDAVHFVVPQGPRRLRLYLLYDAADRTRLAGGGKAEKMLAAFDTSWLRHGPELAAATPVGPCAVFPMHDSWVDQPAAGGVVLIGDAAGFSDPHLGQGLSIALRDARTVGEAILDRDDEMGAYTEERRQRMRRLRWVNDVMTDIRGVFNPEARERRGRALARLRSEPDLGAFRMASLLGPEVPPPEAFSDDVRARLLA